LKRLTGQAIAIEVSRKICEAQASCPLLYSYVFQELENLLGEQLAREGNFIHQTQLDPQMQAQAEAALRNSVNNASSYGFSQAVHTLISALAQS